MKEHRNKAAIPFNRTNPSDFPKGDMVNQLTRQYNAARQALITKELAEILGGAEALKE